MMVSLPAPRPPRAPREDGARDPHGEADEAERFIAMPSPAEARSLRDSYGSFESGVERERAAARGTSAALLRRQLDSAASPRDGEGGDEARALLLSCLLNQAQCALAQSEWAPAAAACTRALALDAASMKAYFRRGKARVELGEFDDAKADLREAAKLDPKSREVREAIAEAKARAEKAKANDKAMYSKMFG